MSGTSADGIDAALVEFNDDGPEMVATHSAEYSPGVKEDIESLIRNYRNADPALIKRVDTALGGDFASAANALLAGVPGDTPVSAIGSHGQTIYHGPDDTPPVTVQIGDPQRIADETGITTVADFRMDDVRMGGQGAPLAPAFHNSVFRNTHQDRAIVNIGGISNITVLAARADLDVIGFDCGPGNTLMDLWYRQHHPGRFDQDGQWAASGKILSGFVQALMSDPYFALPPPKSTGRELFNLQWLNDRWPGIAREKPEDVQAGLLEVTARCIVEAANRFANQADLYVCGGGAHNARLLQRMSALSGRTARTTNHLGIGPDWVEACTFAWLARQKLLGQPGNLPSVTGASEYLELGRVFAPSR